jgi:excisionase family DNA binding protein
MPQGCGQSVERLLQVDEVAEILRVSPRTVYRSLRVPGGIPHCRIGDRAVIDPAALRRWIAGGGVATLAEAPMSP